MKNYTREFVIQRLQENGLKAIYHNKSNIIKHFKKPRNGVIGIKNWGYLDFLKVRAV